MCPVRLRIILGILLTVTNFSIFFFLTNILIAVAMLAQRDSLVSEIEKSVGAEKQDIKGLLDGSGKYTLVYEDEEGDRVLVGDIPWKYVSHFSQLTILLYFIIYYVFIFSTVMGTIVASFKSYNHIIPKFIPDSLLLFPSLVM